MNIQVIVNIAFVVLLAAAAIRIAILIAQRNELREEVEETTDDLVNERQEHRNLRASLGDQKGPAGSTVSVRKTSVVFTRNLHKSPTNQHKFQFRELDGGNQRPVFTDTLNLTDVSEVSTVLDSRLRLEEEWGCGVALVGNLSSSVPTDTRRKIYFDHATAGFRYKDNDHRIGKLKALTAGPDGIYSVE